MRFHLLLFPSRGREGSSETQLRLLFFFLFVFFDDDDLDDDDDDDEGKEKDGCTVHARTPTGYATDGGSG